MSLTYSGGGVMPSALTNRGKMVNIIGTNKTIYSNRPGFARWAARIAGTSNDAGYGISSDSLGNTCVTGFYASSPVTIYNADGSTFGTLTNSGDADTFIVKYNSVGTARWATRIVGSSADVGISISMDSLGNMYVTGFYYYYDVAIFNSDGSLFGTLPNSGGPDAFIVKYNSAGMAQWATRIGGSASESGRDITVDSSGNICVSGYFGSYDLTVYNADGSTFGTLPNYGSIEEAFIVKYNSAGMAQWATHIYTYTYTFGHGISTDGSNNIYVTGYYNSYDATIFNADGSTFGTLPNSGDNDVFIVKYNSTGTAQWATRIADSGNDAAYSISSDGSGNTCVTGFYASSPVTIYNSDGSTFGTLTNSGGPDAFIVKYNSAGMAQWVACIAGSSTDIGFEVSMDSSGNIYVTGFYYSSPVTIYNADGSTFGTIANSGGADAFVVKYNSAGTAQWGTHIGGSGDDIGYSINAVYGNIYVTGYGNSAVTIYNADGSEFGTIPNSGDNDVFIVKYS